MKNIKVNAFRLVTTFRSQYTSEETKEAVASLFYETVEQCTQIARVLDRVSWTQKNLKILLNAEPMHHLGFADRQPGAYRRAMMLRKRWADANVPAELALTLCEQD